MATLPNPVSDLAAQNVQTPRTDALLPTQNNNSLVVPNGQPTLNNIPNPLVKRSTIAGKGVARAAKGLFKGVEAARPVSYLVTKVTGTDDDVRDYERELNQLQQKAKDVVDARDEAVDGGPVDSALQSSLNRLNKTIDKVHDFLDNIKSGKVKWLKALLNSKDRVATVRDYSTKLDEALRNFQMQCLIHISRDVKALHPQISTPIKPTVPKLLALPPTTSHFLGRDDELKQLIKLVSTDEAVHICIGGAPGMGKSALALHMAHDELVKQRFDRFRIFVRLDAFTDVDGIVQGLALQLGIVGDDLKHKILVILRESGTKWLIILDNFESPWDTPHRTKVEELVAELGALEHVTLILTLRGIEQPAHTKWTPFSALQPLPAEAARTILFNVAQRQGPEWDDLLKKFDYVPLAVRLLAHLAQDNQEPFILGLRWHDERTSLLEASSFPDRESSLNASIQLSMHSQRVSEQPNTWKLLSLLSLLPDGVIETDLLLMFKESTFSPSPPLSVLLCTSLVYREFRHKRPVICLLSPIRAFMLKHYPADDDLRDTMLSHYLKVAEYSQQVRDKQDQILREVASQVGNIQAMLYLAVTSRNTRPSDTVLAAIIGFGKFTEQTNLGGTDALQLAITWMGDHRETMTTQDWTWLASCQETLAGIRMRKAETDTARRLYKDAQRSYAEAGKPDAEATCWKRMADSMQASDATEALEGYTTALKLFKAIQNTPEQIDCLKKMSTIYMQQADMDQAEILNKELLQLQDSMTASSLAINPNGNTPVASLAVMTTA